jgi:hypothetical protein
MSKSLKLTLIALAVPVCLAALLALLLSLVDTKSRLKRWLLRVTGLEDRCKWPRICAHISDAAYGVAAGHPANQEVQIASVGTADIG